MGGVCLDVKKKVIINVFEHEYVLLTDNDEEEIIALAERVDAMLREMSSKNPSHSQLMVSIMAALRLTDKLDGTKMTLVETERRLEVIQNEMKKPFEELNDLKQELEATREHYTRTQSEFTKTQIDLGKISREWARVQEEMKDVKIELDVSRENMAQLQAKLFDSQIELLKTKKELDEIKNKQKEVVFTSIPEKRMKLRSLKNNNEEFE